MRVAFSTSTGVAIDKNFLKTKSFTIWDIGPEEACYVQTLTIDNDAGNGEKRIAARADALSDCAIVCARQINGPAAAKLVARCIHPMKTGSSIPVEEIIGKLQQVLRENPPPWIRKAQLGDTMKTATAVDNECIAFTKQPVPTSSDGNRSIAV
jgi:nitrogen fixation protein NifX